MKEFFSQKKPADFQEQVAAFVYYLTRVLGVTNVGPSHVYTCFKDVGVRVPVNISDVVAKAAARRGWVSVSSADGYSPTTHGDNFIEHDLPKKSE